MVLIYTRVSTEDQGANESLPSQATACKRYALNALGLEVPDSTIISDDESGMTLERKGLTHLRALWKKHKHVALIINSSDRLSRRPGHGEELFDEMLAYGVRLFIVLHGRELRLDNPYDRQQLLMEMGFNRTWHFMLRESMTRGNNAALARGSVSVGGARKYGYEKVRAPDRSISLVLVPEEARIVRNIFEWFVYDRLSTAEIKRRLQGTPTPGDSIGFKNGKGWRKRTYGEWNLGTIYVLLHEEAYTGTYTVYEGGSVYQESKFEIPPIIPREVYDEAQRILEKGRKQSRRNASITDATYLLARRITCACGTAVQSAWNINGNKPYYYYRCGTYVNAQHSTREKCGLPYFKQAAVDDLVWSWLVEKCRDEKGLARILQESKKETDTINARLYDRLAQIDNTRARMLQELETLIAMQSRATAPSVKALFERKIQEANDTDQELTEEEEKIKAQLQTATISQGYVDQWNKTAREITLDLPLERKRYYLDRLNISATLAYEDGMRVVYVHIHAHTERLPLDGFVSLSSSGYKGRECHVITFRLILPQFTSISPTP